MLTLQQLLALQITDGPQQEPLGLRKVFSFGLQEFQLQKAA